MKCPKCQFENREGARFCGECGQEFEATCPGCETPNRAENKFCDACGYDLRKPEGETQDERIYDIGKQAIQFKGMLQ